MTPDLDFKNERHSSVLNGIINTRISLAIVGPMFTVIVLLIGLVWRGAITRSDEINKVQNERLGTIEQKITTVSELSGLKWERVAVLESRINSITDILSRLDRQLENLRDDHARMLGLPRLKKQSGEMDFLHEKYGQQSKAGRVQEP